ncbi:hypothetical protein KAI92_00250, partial [Candidatus Parcubacteria bacterium]|nr:hypothetical protein [Candidatus Parcubacteria bacterium]
MKYLIIIILSLSILLTGCKKEEVSNNSEINNTTKPIDNSTITQKVSSSTQENQNNVDYDDWKTYSSEEYGFEFKYPVYAVAYIKYWDGNYKECNVETKNSFFVPYDVFSKNGNFYLREQYFYNKESCEKELNSYNIINRDESEILTPWHLRVVNVDNDDELGNFIKKNFGESCTYNKNKTRDGIFSIVIQGDGKSLADTNCPVNYESILKYDSKNKRLIYWNLGQECILKKLDSEC